MCCWILTELQRDVDVSNLTGWITTEDNCIAYHFI